jgi:hypothetical protein
METEPFNADRKMDEGLYMSKLFVVVRICFSNKPKNAVAGRRERKNGGPTLAYRKSERRMK